MTATAAPGRRRSRRRDPRGPVAPSPWWGEGEAPHRRWPTITIEIPCRWASSRARWESPDGTLYFDEAAAEFAEQFFPDCLEHHIGSEWTGKPFVLMPYQRYLVRALFGWKRTADQLRRFRKVFLAVPKGSGKSAFASGLGIFLAFFDGEAGAEVYAVAADRKQAGIVHDTARTMLRGNADLAARCDILRDSIKLRGSTEYFQVLSSDASTKHGFRPHGIIFDEFHAQPDRDLYDALYRGMGKRRQPVLVMITTAGNDDESICAEEWDYGRRIISGTVPDPVYLPMIFELQPDEDWTSEAALRRVNPGYGITMKAEYFENEVRAALAEPRKRNAFLQLHGNRWTSQATAWIPIEWWDGCQTTFTDAALEPLDCAAGLDLAQKWDLAAFVVVFRRLLAQAADSVEVVGQDTTGAVVKTTVALNYELFVRPYFWIPENTLKLHEQEDGVPYSLWVEQGLVTATEGDIIDYSRIYQDITTRIVPRYPRLKSGLIGYDPAFASDLSTKLRDLAGLKIVEVLQNYQHLSEPSQIVEALIKGKRVHHDGHRVLRWNFENVAVKRDDAGRIRPVKSKQAAKRIDGAVATIMAQKALGLSAPEPTFQMLFFGKPRR
jgi:phage terminase large subunit-like protein